MKLIDLKSDWWYAGNGGTRLKEDDKKLVVDYCEKYHFFVLTDENVALLAMLNNMKLDLSYTDNSEKTVASYRPASKVADNKITVYGCGKFGEEKLVLDKLDAALLYIELHRFLGY